MGKKMPLRNIMGVCTTFIKACAISWFLETAAIADGDDRVAGGVGRQRGERCAHPPTGPAM
jgi:hypothetical protein